MYKVSEETLKEVFRFFKEYENLEAEYNESWKKRFSEAIYERCLELNISEDEIILQLFTQNIENKYKPIIRDETMSEYLKFYGFNLEAMKNDNK